MKGLTTPGLSQPGTSGSADSELPDRVVHGGEPSGGGSLFGGLPDSGLSRSGLPRSDLPRSGLPRDWLPSLLEFLDREPVVVRIVVAEVRGSTPREPGAFMLVGCDSVLGSIGGGQLEWEAVANARDLLTDTAVTARVNKVVLAADVGQCCGGVVSVWLERFTREDLGLLRMASDAGARGRAVLSSTITGGAVERRVVLETRQPALPILTRNAAGAPTLLERLDDEFPSVWLYGAGHVGHALARILVDLPLRLTWIDSRSELLPDTPGGGARILRDPDSVATVSEAPVGAYFIVMSHSHPLDFALCHALLERNDFAWLGLIGSLSKAARFRSRLTRAGLGAAVIRKLVCPIGVAGIESKWPGAIAVAVAAQLMQEISAAGVEKTERLLEGPRALRAQSAQAGARLEAASGEAMRDGVARAIRDERSDDDSACAPENCATCGSAAVRRGTVTS